MFFKEPLTERFIVEPKMLHLWHRCGMIESDHQRSAAKTLVNTMALNKGYLCYLKCIAGLSHILNVHFSVLIHLSDTESVFVQVISLNMATQELSVNTWETK